MESVTPEGGFVHLDVRGEHCSPVEVLRTLDRRHRYPFEGLLPRQELHYTSGKAVGTTSREVLGCLASDRSKCLEVGGDDSTTGRHSFKQRDPEALAAEIRSNKHLGCTQDRTLLRRLDPSVKTNTGNQSVSTGSDDVEFNLGCTSANEGPGSQQDIETFSGFVPADERQTMACLHRPIVVQR